VKIAIYEIAVDPARVNSAYPTRTKCRAGTAVNFSVVHLSKKLPAVPARRDFNSGRDFNSALLTLAVSLLTLAVPLLTLAGPLLTLAVSLLTLAGPLLTLAGPLLTLAVSLLTLAGPLLTLAGPLLTLAAAPA
jgi:hypothetical protein